MRRVSLRFPGVLTLPASSLAARSGRAPAIVYSTAASALRSSSLHVEHVEALTDAAERRLLSLFETYGSSDYIGEPMSITEHSVQVASAAAKAGEDDTAVLACLLHDVGHLLGLEAGHAPGMGGCGTPEHERIGAEFLGALGLPDDVAYLTHHHVSAKRYLCTVQPGYHDRLTEASKITLEHQGGPMSAAEVAAAEAHPCWPAVLRMRTYDEAGKDPHAAFTSPREFVPLLRAALRASAAEAGSERAYPLSPHAPTYVLSEEQLRFFREHGHLLVAFDDGEVVRYDEASLAGSAKGPRCSSIAAQLASSSSGAW